MFKIGDKVMCIKPSYHAFLKYGRVYTVIDITNIDDNSYLVVNDGYDNSDEGGYFPDRFVLATPLTEELS